MSELPAAALLALSLGSTGCSFGLYQTAKPLPYGDVRMSAGASMVTTNRAAETDQPSAGSKSESYLFPDLGFRVGAGRRTEVGAGMYLGPGARVDVKHDLFETRRPYALAPRLGVGYSVLGGNVFSWLAGMIGSYDLVNVLSVYAGATFVNHHIHRSPSPGFEAPLGPNERHAPRSGVGDGLMQLAVGIEVPAESVVFHFEYGRWLPMQNDPGDRYRFVPAEVLGLSIGPCLSGPCRAPRR